MQRLAFAGTSQVQPVRTHAKHPSVSKDKKKRELDLERDRQRKRAAYAKKKAQLAEYKEALKDTSTAQKVMTVATAHSCKNFWNTNFENEVIRLKNDAYHLLRAPYESK